MSEDQPRCGGKEDRAEKLREWVRLQRTVLPIDTAIDQVRSRSQKATDDDRDILEFELYCLLTEARRNHEALQLLDAAIAQRPNDVLSPHEEGWPYYHHVDDADEALQLLDFALQRARRTGAWVRNTLGSKAWILVHLRHGEELGQVLEQIMSHTVRSDVPDIGRERYFVDASPPGLIRADIRARYDAFCPRRAGDVPFASEFEPPEFGPGGDEIPVTRPRRRAAHEVRVLAIGVVRPDELDRMILANFRADNWRKTAAVIGWTSQECEQRQMPVSHDDIFDRILQLVMSGMLESQGNLSLWRHSEIRPFRGPLQ